MFLLIAMKVGLYGLDPFQLNNSVIGWMDGWIKSVVLLLGLTEVTAFIFMPLGVFEEPSLGTRIVEGLPFKCQCKGYLMHGTAAWGQTKIFLGMGL